MSYTEYGRIKITYLTQTRVSFFTSELVELIVTTIVDPNAERAILEARYETTSHLRVGIVEYKKISKVGQDKSEKDVMPPTLWGIQQDITKRSCAWKRTWFFKEYDTEK